MEFYDYIVMTLCGIKKFTVQNGKIQLHAEGVNTVHEEQLFNPDTSLTTPEIETLKQLSQRILQGENPEFPAEFPLLKCFYCITHERYFVEEPELDKYGRVSSKNLVEGFNEILKVPMADILRAELDKKLGIEKNNQLDFILTCDFDITNIWDLWSFKTLVKQSAKAVLSGRINYLFFLWRSYFKGRKNPKHNGYLNHNMFDYSGHFRNIGFFLADMPNAEFDGINSYNDPALRVYLESLRSNKVEFGLHTNFGTMDAPETVQRQQEKFVDIFGKPTLLNRHHYLRCRFPDYLDALEANGISEDFSMYFAENLLFRCGTSMPFTPWNAKENRPYRLRVSPTTIMDGTFSDYMHIKYDEALSLSKQKIDLALRYSSRIVLLWHNHCTFQHSHLTHNYHPDLISNLKKYLLSKHQNG